MSMESVGKNDTKKRRFGLKEAGLALFALTSPATSMAQVPEVSTPHIETPLANHDSEYPTLSANDQEALHIFDAESTYRFISAMNHLHDSSPEKRLEILKGLDSKELFGIMITSGADAYLSTFRLLYNGNGVTGNARSHSFIQKAILEKGSLYASLLAIKPTRRDFAEFIELVSKNNLLDQFLSDIGGPDQQRDILTRFFFETHDTISIEQAISFDELLRTSTSEEIRNFLLDSLRGLTRNDNANKHSRDIARLLTAPYIRGTKDEPLWAKKFADLYEKKTPNKETLGTTSVFRTEGDHIINSQKYFFYDDRGKNKPDSAWDGHQSFRNFIMSLGGSVSWDTNGMIHHISVGNGYNIKDEGDYVAIRKQDAKTKRMIVMYANKPDRSDDVIRRVHVNLMRETHPQIVIHRGHSFHAHKTIQLLTPEVALVNLGSCAGANNILRILDKSPDAQIMSTQGVGTMLVNDTVLQVLNTTLLQKGEVSWPQLQTQLDQNFTQKGGEVAKRWNDYLLPHRNKVSQLVNAITEAGHLPD
ncbi:hypothetical protein HYT05_04460 [Candidatus Kaiserbacteria bacterium]|nr:hypothetical protein [Candidatus Kaiserbacteria bacterium]